MGNLNEIQKQTTQSYGDNSFTTTIKENTVEFDSAKDSFTFNDEVNVPSLKVNGQEITPTEPQVQADWNQTTSTESDYILNKPAIKAGQGVNSIIEGVGTTASGNYSHAEGAFAKAIRESSHAEGYNTTASGSQSHAEGNFTTASGTNSHTEGNETTASGTNSHAEGAITAASGINSHAEGQQTTASGPTSHAEGCQTTASGANSHAEGRGAKSTGPISHAEGNGTTAEGNYSHAEGQYVTAKNRSQHAFGEYNKLDQSTASSSSRGNYVEIVGNGVDENTRSNARTLDWSGNENIAGMLRIGSSSSTGGCLFKVEGTSLKISFDNGTTWLTVSAS